MLAEVLFVSTTVVLNILDREMEFISLRAMGASPGRIRSLVVLEDLVLLMGGLALGLPLSLWTTRETMAYLVEDLMYYQISVPWWVYAVTALVALAATVASSYLSASHVTKRKLADTIRQRILT